MKNLWLKSRDKAALSIKEASFHQSDQPSNTPGNQAADQMVEITVKAPAEAVYRAGKKSAQDAAHKLKERRETTKTAQAVQEKMSAEENSYQTGETTSTPDATPISGSNKSVQERQFHHTLSHTPSEDFTPGKDTFHTPSRFGSTSSRPWANTGTSPPKKAGNTGVRRTGPAHNSKAPKTPQRDIKVFTPRVKSTRQAGKTIKTAPPALSVSKSATQTVTQGSVRKAWAAVKRRTQTARASAKGAKAFGKAAAAAAKGAFTAIQNATTLLLSGGGAAMLVVLVICLIGLVAGSSFGIFFSGEDNGTGQTIRTAIAQINQEYQDRLEKIKDSHTFDTLEISGSQAVWKEVLAIYAIKTTTDPEGQEVASIDNEKLGLLAEIFWEMNQLDAIVETHTDSTESETSMETEVTVLVITVTHKTALEMAQVLNFDSNQKEQLQELLSPEFDDLWNELLYGVTLGSGNGDLVAVAQSQVGNVGGAPYWSWYGFSSRVEWCAIFVSWCADQCGLLDSGAVPKFSGVGTGVNWFQSRGQWLPGSAIPEPGMLIFFKWYGSDSLIADHVGIVERVENGRVYTIEGNSGDMVRRNSYPIGYGEILGYGMIVDRTN